MANLILVQTDSISPYSSKNFTFSSKSNAPYKEQVQSTQQDPNCNVVLYNKKFIPAINYHADQ
jgi:hypothetical protein